MSGPRRDGLPLALVAAAAPLPVFLLVTLLALPAAAGPAALLASLGSPASRAALRVTLEATTASTFLAVVLGTPLAFLLARGRFRGQAALEALVDLPIAIPPVVVGLALLLAFGRSGLLGRHLDALGVSIPFTLLAVVLAQLAVASPFYVKAARAAFEGVDPALERVAATLGAGPWRVFATVTLPLAGRGLCGGAILAWARALSEFGATIMFAGNLPGRTQTLTLAVVSALESDVEVAVALALESLVLAGGALLLARRLTGRPAAAA